MVRPVLFFFNDTATTEIYTLSLHDALPISDGDNRCPRPCRARNATLFPSRRPTIYASDGSPNGVVSRTSSCASNPGMADRKSTRLNSSHSQISYAVFCLKKTTPTRSQDRLP